MADGSITIDGRSIPFRKGETVIQAAYRAGVDIPHYCWHPGLSAPANCRMCLVEIAPPPGRPAMMLDVLQWDPVKKDYVADRKPKLQPACYQPCSDGLEIKSDTSEHVAEARAAVQELLLLNHPVDCPICDQAGECTLQDYWLEHQRTKKRMLTEPVHKPKAVVFGETIVYDAERCIMCTRCIRVCDEVAGDPVLDMRERGNRNEIVLSPGRTLDHDYSLMTEHVCPVGALTSSHFRFKARVWFLRSGRSVCQGCATGCNAYLDYDPRDNTPYRYRPRDNEEVNGYWMCDEGMLSYPRAYEGRLLHALVGGDDATLTEAFEAARSQLKGHEDEPEQVAVVLSATHSTEDNFALATLARTFIGTDALFVARRPPGRGDDVLMSVDKNANARGVAHAAARAGASAPRPLAELLEAVDQGRYRYVISLGAEVDVDPTALRGALSGLKAFVAIASHEGELPSGAHIALPGATWAETTGLYINEHGRSQRADAVLNLRGDARPGWELVVRLARAMGYAMDWSKRSDLLAALAPPSSSGASSSGASSSSEAASSPGTDASAAEARP